jgi:hypothetical protein
MKKTCSKCKQEKDAFTEFYAYKGNLRTECKKCTLKRTQADLKKKLLFAKEEFAAHRREYMKQYYLDHVEEYRGYRKKFKDKNPDYFKNYGKS